MKIRDIKTYVLDTALAEPFAYSQAWYERRGACLVEIVGEDGPRSFALGAGTIAVIPQGAWHQITAGEEELRFLCCCAPGYQHADTFFE